VHRLQAIPEQQEPTRLNKSLTSFYRDFLSDIFLKRKKKGGCTEQGEAFLEMLSFADRESIFKITNATKEHPMHQPRRFILAPYLNLTKANQTISI